MGCKVMFVVSSKSDPVVAGRLKTPQRLLAMALVMVGTVSFSAFADIPEALSTVSGAEPVAVLANDAGATLASGDLLLSVDVGVDLWRQTGAFGDVLWQDTAFESVLATDASYQGSLAADMQGGLLLESTAINLGPPIYTDYDAVTPSPTTSSVSAPTGQATGDGTGQNTTFRTPWSGRLTVDQSLAPVAVDTSVDEGGYFSISISTAPAPGALVLALLGFGLVGAFRAADRRS